MSTCTFFGHRDAPKKIETELRLTIIDLIENENVSLFYVGNHGNFDRMVLKNLKLLKQEYPHIKYFAVLAYMPENHMQEDYELTIIPEAVEKVPYKYAILERNRWMISKSDFVVGYAYMNGNSLNFLNLAERKGLIVINLADKM